MFEFIKNCLLKLNIFGALCSSNEKDEPKLRSSIKVAAPKSRACRLRPRKRKSNAKKVRGSKTSNDIEAKETDTKLGNIVEIIKVSNYKPQRLGHVSEEVRRLVTHGSLPKNTKLVLKRAMVRIDADDCLLEPRKLSTIIRKLEKINWNSGKLVSPIMLNTKAKSKATKSRSQGSSEKLSSSLKLSKRRKQGERPTRVLKRAHNRNTTRTLKRALQNSIAAASASRKRVKTKRRAPRKQKACKAIRPSVRVSRSTLRCSPMHRLRQQNVDRAH